MCIGNSYCPTCQPSAAIEAWTRGDIHEMPVPSDGAQQEVMMSLRDKAFKEALAFDRKGVEQWPEYVTLQSRLGLAGVVSRHADLSPALHILTVHDSRLADWIRRGRRLQRRGKDPNKRPKFREAMRRLDALFDRACLPTFTHCDLLAA